MEYNLVLNKLNISDGIPVNLLTRHVLFMQRKTLKALGIKKSKSTTIEKEINYFALLVMEMERED